MNLVFTETEVKLLTDFIKGMMNPDPNLRLSAKQALVHPVFTLIHLLKSAEEQKLLPKNKDLFLFLKYACSHQIERELRRTEPPDRELHRLAQWRRSRRL
jgi:serine/threonine protein kinase